MWSNAQMPKKNRQLNRVDLICFSRPCQFLWIFIRKEGLFREIWIFGKKIDNIVFVYFLLCFSLTSKTIFHLNKIEKCGKVPFFYLVHQWMENIFIYILLIAIITVWDGQSLEFLFVLMDVNIHRVQLFFFLYRTRSSLSETPNCDKWRD